MRFSGSWGSQISRQSIHEGGKAVSPTHQPLLPHRKYSWYSFLLEAESTPGLQFGRKEYFTQYFLCFHYVHFFIPYLSCVYCCNLMCVCLSHLYLLYLMCICCILCVFVVSYVYLLYFYVYLLYFYVYLLYLCVFVVLCVYWYSYFRCRTAG